MRLSPLDATLARDEPTAFPPSSKGPNVFGDRWEMHCDSEVSYRVQLCDVLGPSSTVLADAIADRRTLLVITPTVARLYGARLESALRGKPDVSTLVLEVSETDKTLKTVDRVCQEALRHGMTRKGLLVAVGGGVCSDIVTVAASLLRRGIGHLRVPTTLIGQIDAGIGIKGAVNFRGKKSFLGCFHPPEQVLIDPAFLRSLPPRFLVCGMAEAIKMAIGRDPRLFALLEQWAGALVASGFSRAPNEGKELLERSISSMLDELSRNPYEDRTLERLVDFGHTFSPALEGALGFEIHHGEAVAVDMALCATLSHDLGLLSSEALHRILGLLRHTGLPTFSSALTPGLCDRALAEAARHRGGRVNLVLPTGIGRTMFIEHHEDLPDLALRHALRHLAELSGMEAAS